MNPRPIEIFIRHYREDLHSISSRDPRKLRPNWYSPSRCISSLIRDQIMRPELGVRITIFFDGPQSEVMSDSYLRGLMEPSFSNLRILTIRGEGTVPIGDLGGFQALIKHICTDKTISEDSVVYLCENDYLHRPNFLQAISNFFDGARGKWREATLESGVELVSNHGTVVGDYLSLYDNPDYYRLSYHQSCPRRIAERGGILYRQERSVTASFVTLKATLEEDLGTFLWKTDDFDFFSRLALKGRSVFVTSPAFSTHSMLGMTAPSVDWDSVSELDCQTSAQPL